MKVRSFSRQLQHAAWVDFYVLSIALYELLGLSLSSPDIRQTRWGKAIWTDFFYIWMQGKYPEVGRVCRLSYE